LETSKRGPESEQIAGAIIGPCGLKIDPLKHCRSYVLYKSSICKSLILSGKELPVSKALFSGMNAGKRALEVSAPKNKKNAKSGNLKHPSSKRSKGKLIRLDDLIPKQNVTGGHQLLFGVTDAIQTTKTTNNPKQES
jgi:hypothetical protein